MFLLEGFSLRIDLLHLCPPLLLLSLQGVLRLSSACIQLFERRSKNVGDRGTLDAAELLRDSCSELCKALTKMRHRRAADFATTSSTIILFRWRRVRMLQVYHCEARICRFCPQCSNVSVPRMYIFVAENRQKVCS